MNKRAQDKLLEVVYKPIGELVPYAKNSRTHSEEQIAAIAVSLRKFGWTNPVLVDGNGIIAGHGRVLAAPLVWDAGGEIKRTTPGLVPTTDLSDLTEDEKRAYVIADNQLALRAGWDNEILRAELADLKALDFDLAVIGFNDFDLAGLMTPKSDKDPDATPEPPAVPKSVLGDVWVMGKHRIVCGDSTDADTVAKALNGVTPHLMVTDPPYGVEYDANWRNEAVRSNGSPIAGRAIGKVQNDNRSDWREAWALFPGDVAYVWFASNMAPSVGASLEANDFELRSLIIWAKSQFAIGRGHYHWQHEPCWYAVKKGGTGHWGGDRKQTTLWQIDKPQKSETGHSTQKPVECMKRPIENNSSPGQAVYEPFSGSGTTIIAAEMTGRACHAIELSPAYVDVAVKRWQEYSGLQAVHAETGELFDEG